MPCFIIWREKGTEILRYKVLVFVLKGLLSSSMRRRVVVEKQLSLVCAANGKTAIATPVRL